MLSEKIKALADSLVKYREVGLQMTPNAVDSVVFLLRSFTEDAEAIEKITIPSAARLSATDLPDNVIHLAHFLNRKGCRIGFSSHDGNGGNAA